MTQLRLSREAFDAIQLAAFFFYWVKLPYLRQEDQNLKRLLDERRLTLNLSFQPRHPVVSPQTAVRAAIIAKRKRAHPRSRLAMRGVKE
jgi:hypothetical protein